MLLGPDDPLALVPQRILVCGGSGSGKSTLARRIADGLALPYTELDSLYHGPGWTQRETFLDDVRAVAGGERWVSEWQYDTALAILLGRSDLLVWLDIPRRVTTWRVIRRTVRRRFSREVIWNGNREGPLWRIATDPDHIIRWAWSSYPKAAARVAGALRERPDLPVVRLRSSRERTRWLESLSEPAGRPEPPR